METMMTLQAACDEFNVKYPVGTKVFVRRDKGEMQETVTRSKAEVLSGHSAVIWLEGISGCYLLDRVHVTASPTGEAETKTGA
jgi:hypothetical protein